MRPFPTLLFIIIIATIISACAAPAAPTADPADIQNTAAASAFTMVAQTQAAVPTETAVPPTDTPTVSPVPTETTMSLPTLAVSVAATSAGAAQGNPTVDPCSSRVLSAPQGKATTIRIANTTKVAVTVSIYLSPTAGHGECGYRSYSLAKNSDIIITDLVQGCYSLWAWSTEPKESFNSSGGGCINNPDKWTFEIRQDMIKDTGP